jgi:hypothetical protein
MMAAGSSNSLTSTRCCRYSCVCSWWWVDYHLKHAEQFSDINKLCNIASCWIYIGIYLRCTDPWMLNLSIYDVKRLVCHVLWVPLGLMGPMFRSTTNSHQYVSQILTPLFNHLCHYLRIYAIFQQDHVTIHIVNNPLHFLLCFWPNKKQMIVATMFTRLESVQFCLSFILMDKMCSNIPHTEHNLKKKH